MSFYLNFSHDQQTIDHFSWNSREQYSLTQIETELHINTNAQ